MRKNRWTIWNNSWAGYDSRDLFIQINVRDSTADSFD